MHDLYVVAAVAVYLFTVWVVAKFCGFNETGHEDMF